MKTKQLNKTKNGYSALVISVMCAIIMTIIGQSLNNHNNMYAGAYNSTDKISSGYNHASAPHTVSSEYGPSYSIIDDITAFIALQKQTINNYIMDIEQQFGIQKENAITEPETQVISHNVIGSPESSIKPEYIPFATIKETLFTQHCDIPTSIKDNDESKLIAHIQWGLQHCLITVSSAQKVYPTDILTHKMMRIIAQRAGFTVKMEYASDANVTRADLVNFLYALQQQHKISDLPVIQTSNPVTRGEYITLLHSIFGETPAKDHTAQIENNVTPPTINNAIENEKTVNITVKEFKQTLINQGKDIKINEDDAHTSLNLEIMNSLLSDNQEASSGVGVDTTVIKETINRIIEKI